MGDSFQIADTDISGVRRAAVPFVVVNACRPAGRPVVELWQQWALQCYQYRRPHTLQAQTRAVILSAYLSVLLDGTERDRQTERERKARCVCGCVSSADEGERVGQKSECEWGLGSLAGH